MQHHNINTHDHYAVSPNGGGTAVLVQLQDEYDQVRIAVTAEQARHIATLLLSAAQTIEGPAAGEAGLDLVPHLHRQRAFSLRTFGPGMRTEGVCDHIRKELLEIQADPTDVKEWVDVVLLALDGAWRAGHTPEVIAQEIAAKQTKNEGRNWPAWQDAEPGKAIEHVRD